jgi:hypothetical protein
VPHQIALDVARAFPFAETRAWPASTRTRQCARLAQLLTRVCDGDCVHYYQGLHDVAAVLLLALDDDALATACLRALVADALRPFVQASMAAAVAALETLGPLLRTADARVATAVSVVPPFFALPWVLTWFAHVAPRLTDACEAFDLFLCAPSLPLFAAAAVCLERKDALVAEEADAGAVQAVLQTAPAALAARTAARWTPTFTRAVRWWLAAQPPHDACSPVEAQARAAVRLLARPAPMSPLGGLVPACSRSTGSPLVAAAVAIARDDRQHPLHAWPPPAARGEWAAACPAPRAVAWVLCVGAPAAVAVALLAVLAALVWQSRS